MAKEGQPTEEIEGAKEIFHSDAKDPKMYTNWFSDGDAEMIHIVLVPNQQWQCHGNVA